MRSDSVPDMYRVGVERSFSAKHYLTVPDAGEEGSPHTHQYRVQLVFHGPELDQWGYLIDIDVVEELLDDLEARYDNAMLNDLAAFEDANPSVERFARVIGDQVSAALEDPTPTSVTVKLWEGENAWASCQRSLGT